MKENILLGNKVYSLKNNAKGIVLCLNIDSSPQYYVLGWVFKNDKNINKEHLWTAFQEAKLNVYLPDTERVSVNKDVFDFLFDKYKFSYIGGVNEATVSPFKKSNVLDLNNISYV